MTIRTQSAVKQRYLNDHQFQTMGNFENFIKRVIKKIIEVKKNNEINL